MTKSPTKKLTLRVTEAEYEALQRVSARRGIRVTEFVSEVAVKAASLSEKDPRISIGVGTFVQVFLPGKDA